ncbi:hypothetical protein OG985_12770 [Streptomyces sp. NBC_00289]|uniref:hypothetical protein n=1 Tax=Streptomyces sp. NBC_00289 TaxID=2975703 RepID=UPI00324E9E8E
MSDSTLWIFSVTAGTAVLAGWVTSRGTARTAQIQAHAAVKTQRAVRVGEARRSAHPFRHRLLVFVSTARSAVRDL